MIKYTNIVEYAHKWLEEMELDLAVSKCLHYSTVRKVNLYYQLSCVAVYNLKHNANSKFRLTWWSFKQDWKQLAPCVHAWVGEMVTLVQPDWKLVGRWNSLASYYLVLSEDRKTWRSGGQRKLRLAVINLEVRQRPPSCCHSWFLRDPRKLNHLTKSCRTLNIKPNWQRKFQELSFKSA